MWKIAIVVVTVVAAVGLLSWWNSSSSTPLAPSPAATPTAPTAAAVTAPLENAAVAVAPDVASERIAAATNDGAWRVRGRVVKGAEVAYPNARVRIAGYLGRVAEGEPWFDREVTAGGDGRFELGVPTPTTTVTLQGHGTMARHTAGKTTEIVAKGDAAPELVVWTSPFDRVTTGTVLTVDAKPIAGAWVGTTRDKRPVDADGSFRIETASSGGQRIEAGAAGFTTQRQNLDAGDQATTTVHFRLQPGLRIAGRVVDEQGQPIAAATVATFFTLYEPDQSAADGTFAITIADAARDRHSLFARKAGYVETRIEVDGKELQANYELVLRRGARVHGRVFDPTGAAVAGAELYIGFSPAAYNRLEAGTNDDGTFEFAAVEVGKQLLTTTRTGFAPDSRVLEVPATGELAVDVHLQAPHFVAGRVVDAAGTGLPGVMVSVRTKRPATNGLGERSEYLDVRATTDGDGAFRIDGLPAGVVDLEAYSRRTVRHTEADVAVDRGDVRLVVKVAAQLAGRVVDDATGEPVREFRVHLVEPQLRAGEQRVGGYSASWVREGHSYRSDDGVWLTKDEQFEAGSVCGVEVTAKGYAAARHLRAVAAAEPDPELCVVRLQRGGTLTGTVTRADGTPIAGARLLHFTNPQSHDLIDEEHGGRLRTTTAADGTFTLADVPAGTGWLQVRAQGLPEHRDGPIVVVAGTQVDRRVLVPAASTLEGVVLDLDGNALPSAKVHFACDELRVSDTDVVADAQGRFRTPPLAAGTYRLRSQASRGGVTFALCDYVVVPPAQAVACELRPRGRGVLRGTVTGLPPGGPFQVNLWQRPSVVGSAVFTAWCADGKFELHGLPPSSYRVSIWAQAVSGSQDVTVGVDQPATVEIVMLPMKR